MSLVTAAALELDFKDIDTIGQGFADEVFRVWQSHHPQIRIVARNAGETVLFMIRHVAPDSQFVYDSKNPNKAKL